MRGQRRWIMDSLTTTLELMLGIIRGLWGAAAAPSILAERSACSARMGIAPAGVAPQLGACLRHAFTVACVRRSNGRNSDMRRCCLLGTRNLQVIEASGEAERC